jgi:hypothetical protein
LVAGTGRENAREAARYFSLACEAGSAAGCFNLAYLFQHGIGCPRDESLAVKVSGVCGVWCVVCGVWCVVCGVWCVVCGVWCVVCGVCVV